MKKYVHSTACALLCKMRKGSTNQALVKPHSACDKLALVFHQTWTKGNGIIPLSLGILYCVESGNCYAPTHSIALSVSIYTCVHSGGEHKLSHSCRKHCSVGRRTLIIAACVRGKDESNRACC
jgi:hypothetical protein